MALGDNERQYLDNLSMLDYLSQTNGFTFKRVGRAYQCVEHDSLIVKQDEKRWYWNSQSLGGVGVVAWKMKIEGMTAKEAVRDLLQKSFPNRHLEAPRVREEKPKEFVLPNHASNNRRAAAYLIKTRGLDPQIVNDCISAGLLYEDNFHNVVAIGYDKNGVAKSADKRSTTTYGKKYRGCVTGSEKKYGFHVDAALKSDTVFVFEAFIDSLSFLSLRNMSEKARNNPDYYRRFNVLALGGVSATALTQYLADRPNIKNVVLCLDNDEAGKTAMQSLKETFSKVANCVIHPVQYKGCKDCNEVLLKFKEDLNCSPRIAPTKKGAEQSLIEEDHQAFSLSR